MRPPSPNVPFIYLRLLCFVLTEQGYDGGAWLARAGIDAKALLNPEAMVNLSQVERFLGEVELGTGRRDWGFHLGKTLKLTSHGTVGFLLVNGDTLGDVMHLCSRYYRMMNPLYVVQIEEHAGLITANFRSALSLPERCRRFYDETIAVSVYQQMMPFFRARRPRRFEIRLSMAEPDHVAYYTELSGARFRFGDADIDGVSVSFDADCLAIPNPLADSGSRAIAEEICRRRCHELDESHGWADWVSKALHTAEGKRPTQAELADLLHMSPRTLERALAREGTSFKEIYERVGHERACAMLREGRLSVSAIAERLGYSSIGAFSRAFKRRDGATPSEYASSLRQK